MPQWIPYPGLAFAFYSLEQTPGGEDEGLLLVVFAKETLSGSFRAVVAVVEEIERFGVVVSYRS